MAALGKHVIVELYGCPGELLDNTKLATSLFRKAVKSAKMTMRQFAIEKFEPIGLTACAVLSESHMTIHTFPELGYCAADVFTCGQEGDPMKAAEVLIEWLQPARYEITTLDRGTDVRSSDVNKKYMDILEENGVKYEVL